MKGFIAFVLVVLLGLSAYNYWEIRSLRQEIAALNEKVTTQSQAGLTDDVVAKAAVALTLAREALNRMDTEKARAAYDDAKARLDQAARTANEKAGPTVRWLRDEAADLGRKLQREISSR